MIVNRHIRNDWQTFVEWKGKSVRTLCGRRSTPRLCGIPGITIQDVTIDNRPGWCPRCISLAMRTAISVTRGENRPRLHPDMNVMYQRVLDICYEYITTWTRS